MMIVERYQQRGGKQSKTIKPKAAGACHYNSSKCLRARYQSRAFEITISQRAALLKTKNNEGISSHHVRHLSVPVANPQATRVHLFFLLKKARVS